MVAGALWVQDIDKMSNDVKPTTKKPSNKKPKAEKPKVETPSGFVEKITYRFIKRHRAPDKVFYPGQLIDLSDQKAAVWMGRGIVVAETVTLPDVNTEEL
jgi:hypothetical protein